MLRNVSGLIVVILILATSACLFDFPFRRELREARHISNLTIDGNYLYFGAGYHLYRLDLSSRSIEAIFTTDRVLAETPVVADGVAYFGGHSCVDQKGNYGETQGLLAVDLRDRKVQWKFPLGVGGYGTYGTFPVLAGDYIIVCARQHLHSLDRKTGKEKWKLDNWFGTTSDGVTIPYVHRDHVYFKISEEYFTKSSEIDGHWAKVALDNGKRVAILPLAKNPGTYHDMRGEGISRLVDGIVYGALRYDSEDYPASRFGALDLENQKLLWEVRGSSLRTKPAVNDKFVFTVIDGAIQALEKTTGRVVWSEPLGDIAETNVGRSQDRVKWEYENRWSRRFVATNEAVIVQGSKGIVARRADTGKLLWLAKIDLDECYTDPVIFQQIVIAVSVKDCSIIAFELKDGRELWRVKVPDCTYFYLFDD